MTKEWTSNTDFPATSIAAISEIYGAPSSNLSGVVKYKIGEVLAQPSRVTVVSDTTGFRVIDGPTGTSISTTSDVDTAIATGIAALDPGRSTVQKLSFVGFFPTTLPTILESFTHLDLSAGEVKPTSGYTGSVSIITNELHAGEDGPKNQHIYVTGGKVDGINTYGVGVGAISNIEFNNIEHLGVSRVHTANSREHGIAFDYSDHVLIEDNNCDTSGDDGITCHYRNDNFTIINNRCHDGNNTTSPSFGSQNGIELENETNQADAAPKNGVVAFNECWNNIVGILAKTEAAKTVPINHVKFVENITHDNTQDGIKVSNKGVGGPRMLGVEFDSNISYSNGWNGLRIENAAGPVIRGGSLYSNGTNGVELVNCEDAKIGGGVSIYLNEQSAVRGNTTVTGTKFSETYLIDNNEEDAFNYAINFDGANTYVGPLTTIKDTRAIPRQLGIKAPTTATNLFIDGPTCDGFKFGGGTRESPIFLNGATAPAGMTVREVKVLNSTADFVTENQDKATGISSGIGFPHGLNLQAANGSIASVNASLSELGITLQAGSPTSPLTAIVDETNITLTFTGGGTVDVFWKIAAHKWAV